MPPQHAEGRGSDDSFSLEEKLYRRFSLADIDSDGQLIAIQLVDRYFPGLSTNRSKYSVPEDVIHPNCCDQKDYAEWGIASFSILELSDLFELSGDNGMVSRRYRLLFQHVPLMLCYAHTEITCCVEGGSAEKFTGKVKRGFRAQLTRHLSIERAPKQHE